MKSQHLNPERESLLVAATLAALVAAPASAQGPKTQAAIPLYPGAVRDQRPGIQGDCPACFTTVYRATATVEDVFKFYVQRLGAQEGVEQDAFHLNPGQSTPVSSGMTTHAFEDDCADEVYRHEAEDCQQWRYGRDKKAAIARARPPYRPGEWLDGAGFGWWSRDANGDRVEWTITLSDSGAFSKDWKSYTARWTEIRVIRMIDAGPPGQALPGRPREAPLPAAGPSEQVLGVPVYPGSWYDARSSAQRGMHVYLSNDPVAKVLQFYEARTGKKGQPQPDQSYWIVLKPSGLPIPLHGVWIQPNIEFGGGYKTAILVTTP